jgi:hypothetical protein
VLPGGEPPLYSGLGGGAAASILLADWAWSPGLFGRSASYHRMHCRSRLEHIYNAARVHALGGKLISRLLYNWNSNRIRLGYIVHICGIWKVLGSY